MYFADGSLGSIENDYKEGGDSCSLWSAVAAYEGRLDQFRIEHYRTAEMTFGSLEGRGLETMPINDDEPFYSVPFLDIAVLETTDSDIIVKGKKRFEFLSATRCERTVGSYR